MEKHSKLVVFSGVFISILSLSLSLHETSLSNIYDNLTKANYLYSIPLLLSLTAYYWIKAVRWKYLLTPVKKTDTRSLISPMMIGFFANNILPAHLGEFIRMYLGAKQLNLKKSLVLATIILERIFDVLAITLFLGILTSLSSNIPQALITAGYIVSITSLILLAAVIMYIFWTNIFLQTIGFLLQFLPSKLTEFIIIQLKHSREGLIAIQDIKLLFKILLSSITQWLFMGLTIYFSLLAIDIKLPFTASIVVLAFTIIAVIIPAAPGFFGTIQLAFVLALNPFNVLEDDAFAASVFFHLFTYFSVLLLGFYLLKKLGKSLHELKEGGSHI